MRRLSPFAMACLLLALLLPALPVLAQQPVYDLEGGREAATPIAIVPMPYSGAAPAPETDIAQVVAADLNRSGRFRTLPEGSLFERPTKGADIRYYGWKALRQDYLVVGRVFDTGEGGYRVEYELHDVAREQRLIGQMLTAQPASMRDLAHQMADAIYERITGVRGAFWTRMAYITQTGHADNARWALVVADADGFNPREVASSRAPLISPAWSPDGRKLAYVDFDRGNSSVYIHDVYAGTRQLVSAFRGINGAPAFSPDGSKLALALSRTGQPEIYVMDLASRALTQLTDHFAIDTEPSWSPDGNWIYFTSDRSGNPQIYRMPAGGGAAERVSFEGRYNATPAVSDDGQKIAVVQAEGNSYRIAQMDNSDGATRWSRLSPGNRDESPSFAPNGSMIVYAATEGGRGLLYVVSADGRVRQRLALSSDVREPAWGPYRSPR